MSRKFDEQEFIIKESKQKLRKKENKICSIFRYSSEVYSELS